MGMFEGPVVFVDIETSGSNFISSKIIEVAAIRVEDGQITDSFTSLLNPGGEVPYWITKLTGIKTPDVVQAPYFEDIAYQLNEILKGAVFIAHNVHFDYSYIKRDLKACGYDFQPKLLCSVKLSRALYPEFKGHSLEKIINRHGLSVASRHRAYDDALAVKSFLDLAYQEKGSNLFNEALSRQLKQPSLPSNLPSTDLDNMPNSPGIYIFEDGQGRPLYVGKSVKLKSRVKSHFTQASTVSKELKLSLATHKVRFIKTDTELEALLLESTTVKELLPLYNRQLRRVRRHYVLLKETADNGYDQVLIADVNLAQQAEMETVYGIYPSRAKAKAALEDRLKTFSLCSKLLGLEKTLGPCFLYQLKKCKGACVQAEPAAEYNQRLALALEKTKVESWPYSTPVAISEGSKTFVVIDKWIILGYLKTGLKQEPMFHPVERRFDLDTYRIIRSFLKKTPAIQVVPLTPPKLLPEV